MTATPLDSTVAWAPEDLPLPAAELVTLSYVVVEEIVGQVALLRRWPWPEVDLLGRLIWMDEHEQASDAAAVMIALLRAQLYTPNKLMRRPRCGDTFAARSPAECDWQAEREVSDLRELLASPVYDISAVAREAAKISYLAGLGAVPPVEKVSEQAQAEQAKTLRARASRPLRALKIATAPRGL